MKNSWTWPVVACLTVAVTTWAMSDQPRAQGGSAATGPQIGVVDIERLFTELQQVKDVDAIMRARGEALRNDATRKSNEIDQSGNLLDQLQPNSPEGRRQRQKLAQLRLEFEAFRRMIEVDTEREKLNWTAETYELALEAVEAVAKRHKLDAVLTRYSPPIVGAGRTLTSFQRDVYLRSVVYHAAQIDLTDEVVREADRIYNGAGGRNSIQILIGPPIP